MQGLRLERTVFKRTPFGLGEVTEWPNVHDWFRARLAGDKGDAWGEPPNHMIFDHAGLAS